MHVPADPVPRSVKVPVAAELLGISERAAWAEVKSGMLRSFKYGRSRLVPVDALDEWLRDRLEEQAS